MHIERSAGIISVEQSVVILRPIERVFAFVADLDNWAQRRPALQGKEQTYHTPVEVGDIFRQVFELQGRLIELLGEVTEYEKDKKLSFHYAWDGSNIEINFIFEPVDRGTRLTGKGQGHASGLLRLFEPLVEGEVNREVEANLNNLKTLLESRAPGDA